MNWAYHCEGAAATKCPAPIDPRLNWSSIDSVVYRPAGGAGQHTSRRLRLGGKRKPAGCVKSIPRFECGPRQLLSKHGRKGQGHIERVEQEMHHHHRDVTSPSLIGVAQRKRQRQQCE